MDRLAKLIEFFSFFKYEINNLKMTWYIQCKINRSRQCSRFRTCCGESGYTASWARPEVFEEILVSPRMLTDHMPDAVFKALVQLADKNFHLREIVKVRRVESIEEGLI